MSQVTSGANENDIKVWDVLIRIFHWSLVVSFFIAYVSEEESLWHIYSGYTVLALIIFRMIWGIVGSKYAQFSSFSYSPINALSYLKEWVDGKPKRYIGHNPAGGLMVIALLASLFVVTISGLKIYAIEEGKGPLSGNGISIIANAYADDDEHKNNKHKDKEGEEFWEEIHEVSTSFTLFLIFLHIVGVTMSSRLHNENLVKSMVTGKKNLNN